MTNCWYWSHLMLWNWFMTHTYTHTHKYTHTHTYIYTLSAAPSIWQFKKVLLNYASMTAWDIYFLAQMSTTSSSIHWTKSSFKTRPAEVVQWYTFCLIIPRLGVRVQHPYKHRQARLVILEKKPSWYFTVSVYSHLG
jgi:hypothetical protein